MTENDTDKQESTKNDDILAELDDLDRAIIRHKIKTPGIKNVELAKLLGKNGHTIGRRLAKDKVKVAIDELQKRAIDILLDIQISAAKYLGAVIKDKKEKTTDRIAASKEVLKGVLSENVNIKYDYSEVQKDLDAIREKILNEERKDNG